MKGAIFFIFASLILGCSEKRKSAVEIIPKNKMTKIVWDVIQVDEFAAAYLTKDSTIDIKTERMKLYAKVFQLHKISNEEFSTSFKYYSGRPDLMKVLFDTLGARAERERKNVYTPKPLQPSKP